MKKRRKRERPSKVNDDGSAYDLQFITNSIFDIYQFILCICAEYRKPINQILRSRLDTVICDSTKQFLSNNTQISTFFFFTKQHSFVLNTINIKFIFIDCLTYNLKSQLIKREILETMEKKSIFSLLFLNFQLDECKKNWDRSTFRTIFVVDIGSKFIRWLLDSNQQ